MAMKSFKSTHTTLQVGRVRFFQMENRATPNLSGLTTGSRNTEPVWSNNSEWVVYSSNRRNGKDTDLYIAKAFDPSSTRLLSQDTGYLKGFCWTPGARRA